MLKCTCFDVDGTQTVLYDCLRFSLVRDRYLPYAALSMKAICPTEINPPVRLQLYLDGTLLHDGCVQHSRITREKGARVISANVQSFTNALTQNQLVPGVHTDVTLSGLMQEYSLPHITYQSDIPMINYIYVKEHTAMWEALVAYNFKLNQGFPYVRVPNQLYMTAPPERPVIALPDTLLRQGSSGNGSGIISRIDMASIDGEYGHFTMTNPEAVRRGICNVKQSPFDLQFLYAPLDGLRYRIALGNRRISAKFLEYPGYCGEDLEDRVQTPFGLLRVSRIVIRGDQDGIRTEDSFFFDSFCNKIL